MPKCFGFQIPFFHSAEQIPNGPTPLPWKIMVFMTSSVAINIAAITQLYSYLGFMVARFFPEYSEEQLGYLSGYIAGAYFISQVISASFWGWITDRYGRKPVLMISMGGCLLSVLMIGFAPSFTIAIFARAFGGFLDSTFPVVKTIITDVTDSSNASRGFSAIALAYGLGTLLGPLIGGLASDPAKQYGVSFGLWEKFPYSPPCLIAALILLTLMISMGLWLPETKGLKEYSKVNQLEMVEIEPENTNLPSNEDASKFVIEDEEDKDIEIKFKGQNPHPVVALDESQNEQNEENHPVVELDEPSPPALRLSQDTSENSGKIQTFWARYKLVGVVIVLYMLQACMFAGWDDIYPLWSLTPISSGGLNFEEKQIGLTLTIGGVILVVFQLSAFNPIVEKIGVLNSFRLGQVFAGAAVLSVPWINRLTFSAVLLWISLFVIHAFRIMGGTLAFTTINILIAQSSPDAIGKINGISFAFAGIAKTIGPTAGTPILAWSEESGLPWPLNYHFVFVLMALISFTNFCISFTPSMRKRWPSPKIFNS